ncbi:hypothetical protein ACFQV2_30245 [Actinokineospora soli]|uniref:MMPL family protein n=1 Tax=Actinokineospora soli TaxID=1048753 RepID=A0ABW2TUQ3_9PSEU
MERFSRFVLGHARLVALAVLAATLLGGAAVALLLPRVTEANTYPGLPGYEANQRILAEFGTGGYERPVVPVVELEGPADLTAAFTAVTERTGARVAWRDPVFTAGTPATPWCTAAPSRRAASRAARSARAPTSPSGCAPRWPRTCRPARACTSPASTRSPPASTRAASTCR